jgi:hypothetical protein
MDGRESTPGPRATDPSGSGGPEGEHDPVQGSEFDDSGRGLACARRAYRRWTKTQPRWAAYTDAVLDEDFLADCPYAPEAVLFDELLEVDRGHGRVLARMPTHDRLPLTALQRADPVRHPRHVSGALMVHLTGMLGFAHAYYVLDLRHADGWVGYGTHIHSARYCRLARIGPPLLLDCHGTQVRRIRGTLYVRYAFRFEQEAEVVYESEQGAVWTRVGGEPPGARRHRA